MTNDYPVKVFAGMTRWEGGYELNSVFNERKIAISASPVDALKISAAIGTVGNDGGSVDTRSVGLSYKMGGFIGGGITRIY